MRFSEHILRVKLWIYNENSQFIHCGLLPWPRPAIGERTQLLLPSFLTLLPLPLPTGWFGALKTQKEGRKEVRDKKDLILLITVVLCFGRGTIAGSFSCGHFDGSLGDSLLATPFLKFSWDRHGLLQLAIGQSTPLLSHITTPVGPLGMGPVKRSPGWPSHERFI